MSGSCGYPPDRILPAPATKKCVTLTGRIDQRVGKRLPKTKRLVIDSTTDVIRDISINLGLALPQGGAGLLHSHWLIRSVLVVTIHAGSGWPRSDPVVEFALGGGFFYAGTSILPPRFTQSSKPGRENSTRFLTFLKQSISRRITSCRRYVCDSPKCVAAAS